MAGAFLHALVPRIHFVAEDEVEVRPRAPDEANAQLPRRLGDFVKTFDRQLEKFVQMKRHGGGRALTDADDAKLLGAQDGHVQLRMRRLDGDCRKKSRAAAAEDENLLHARVG